MRSRVLLFSFILTAGSLSLPLVANAAIPFFGPIIPAAYNVCPASWGLLVTVINNIISLLITLAIVFVAPLMIAWSGFLFVVNPVHASGKEQAKKILLNTIVGIVIAMASWIIVDAVMAVLYHPTATGWTTTWSQLITSGGIPACLPQAGALPTDTFNQATTSGVTAGAGTPLSFGSGACDSPTLQQLVPSLTLNEANTLACLAKPESVCGTTMQNYSWNKDAGKGKASTAYGAFQVTLSSNHSCFENDACYTAAGVLGPLNCQNGFDANGFTATGNAATLALCVKAAANLKCNLTAAVCVLHQQGYGAWTGDPSGAVAQKQCITQYSGM